MGNFTYVFERVERKFLLTPTQYAGLMRVLPEYMQADQYGESTILSLYLDTEDSLLIRRSLEKPVYKEKLRLRSYGVPRGTDNVFLEVKKKVRGVVYKRRICLPLARAMECLAQGSVPAAGGHTEIPFARPAVAMRRAGPERDPAYVVFQIRARLRGAHARGTGPRPAPRRRERRSRRCFLPCLTSIRGCPWAACWC